ncbi:MAG: hypothetical protein V1659_01770 [Candidatus Woesearchaeota archaeon]
MAKTVSRSASEDYEPVKLPLNPRIGHIVPKDFITDYKDNTVVVLRDTLSEEQFGVFYALRTITAKVAHDYPKSGQSTETAKISRLGKLRTTLPSLPSQQSGSERYEIGIFLVPAKLLSVELIPITFFNYGVRDRADQKVALPQHYFSRLRHSAKLLVNQIEFAHENLERFGSSGARAVFSHNSGRGIVEVLGDNLREVTGPVPDVRIVFLSTGDLGTQVDYFETVSGLRKNLDQHADGIIFRDEFHGFAYNLPENFKGRDLSGILHGSNVFL